MNLRFYPLLFGIFSLLSSSESFAGPDVSKPPVAPILPVTDSYFGLKVVDNYRWMESLAGPQMEAWMKGENDFARAYLAKLRSRGALVERIRELNDLAPRITRLSEVGHRFFYLKLGTADQTAKLYVREGLTGEEHLLADPQVLCGTKQRFDLLRYYPSPDGALLALYLAPDGSEQGILRVIDAKTGIPLSDSIDRVWSPDVVWDSSNKFFYYQRLQELGPGKTEMDKELDCSVLLHHLGDSPKQDVNVLGRLAFPELGLVPIDSPSVMVDPDSPYALGVVFRGTNADRAIFLTSTSSLAAGHPQWKKIINLSDEIVGEDYKDRDLYLRSSKGARHNQILHLNLDSPLLSQADVFVPEGPHFIKSLDLTKDALYYKTAFAGLSELHRVDLGNKSVTEVPLPFQGTVSVVWSDPAESGVYFSMTGWTNQSAIFKYDPESNVTTDTHLTPAFPVDLSGYTSQEVFVKSLDGILIPLSIVYKKGIALDGSHPCLLYAYGAYGISIEPNFSPDRIALLERGVVLAFAHVRGGGELGSLWHSLGDRLTKPNSIGDFIACAQFLIDEKYTSPHRLAGSGASAGGLTVGGALVLRPDLFGLIILRVCLLNALRAEVGPNGPGNVAEFGSTNNPVELLALQEVDAYHHVQDGTAYPTVLLTVGLKDPRVEPWHSCKMAARLQAATSSANPVLLRIDDQTGHGIGASKDEQESLSVDQDALLLSLGEGK